MNLQKDAVKNSLTWTMRNKDDLLYNFYLKGKTNMAKAAGEAPYAFVIPANGGDNVDVTDLINTLYVGQHIEVDRAAAAFLGRRPAVRRRGLRDPHESAVRAVCEAVADPPGLPDRTPWIPGTEQPPTTCRPGPSA